MSRRTQSRALPPPLVRRVVSVPLVLAALPLLIATLPLWVMAGLVTEPFLPGRQRPLRLLWFGVVWLAIEWVALARWAGCGCGPASGGGSARRAGRPPTCGCCGWILDRVYATARADLPAAGGRLRPGRAAAPGPAPAGALPARRPGRLGAADPGAGTLAERRPRIVLKDALQLDPTVDILLNRLPNRFITPRPGVAEDVE